MDPANSQRHFLFTMDAQNNPYYNVYDRTLPGYGSIGAMEAPLNRPLFIPGNGVNHAACMAVIDDRTGAAPPVLYLMRRGSTQSQLVAIRLDDLDNVQPIPLHTYSDFGAGTMPEMQVSPDGQYLAVSSRVTNSGSIFPALETYKIILFRIDPDHLGLTEVGTLAVPNTVRISSLDFSPESAYLYFVRTISEEGHRLYRVAVPGFSAMEAVNTGARITEVRRIKGDRMLLTNVTAINGGQRNIYALHTPNAATGTLAAASAGLIWSFNSTSPYITTALSPHLALQPLIIHTENPIYTRTVDLKRYELTDHLGNVRAVVSDRLLADYDVTTNADPTNLRARVLVRSDYYPFGSLLPGRNYSSGSYRHLFQGQEHDDEINGAVGTSYAFEYRIHDPRVGRFLSIDPLAAKYAYNSPYAFSENRVIDGVELEGLETVDYRERQTDGVTHQLDIDKNGTSDGSLRPTTSVDNTTFNNRGTPSTQRGNATPGVSNGVQSIVGAAAAGNANMPGNAGAAVQQATTGNPPPGGSGVRVALPIRNQFDQSFAVTSGPVGGPAPNVAPSTVANVTNAINGVNPLSQVLPNNTSRVLIIVNGSAPSIAQVNADMVALQAAFPNVNFSVAAVPGHPQFNTPALGFADGNVVVAVNPTQNYLNTRGVTPANTLVPFTGSTAPAPAPPGGALPLSFGP